MVVRERHQYGIVKGRAEWIFSGGGNGSVFLVDKQIASTRAECVKGDTCQGRPMVRCPSVPVGSAIMPKTREASWACLFPPPLLAMKRVVGTHSRWAMLGRKWRCWLS